MKITFQFIHDSEDINANLLDAVKEAIRNLYDNLSDDEIIPFYNLKYNLPLRNSKSIAGCEIDLEELQSEDYDEFLDIFASSIKDDEHVFALIKFNDETRFESYLNYYREIAELEMQLREILSCIFYYEYSDDFYDLLEEYDVKLPKNTPDEEILQDRLENQFFYMTFSNYLVLDKPKEFRHIKDMKSILEISDSYDDFKIKILNRGIKNEKHLDFLAAIKENLDTIEHVRNSVAHNRTISSNSLGYYESAKSHLNESFREFWVETEEVD